MPVEAEQLYRLGFEAESNVLEIGSYFGKSTFLIARGMKDAGRILNVISIDVHFRGIDENDRPMILADDAPMFLLRTLREHGLDDIVIHMIGWSHIAARFIDYSKIGTVFIDGGHDYDCVRRDFLAVRDRIDAGTLLLFHDYGEPFPGVQRVIDEMVRTDPGFSFVGLWHSLFACRMLTGVTSVEGLRHRIETLDEQLAREAEARRIRESEVAELRASTSWRMTGPLRWGMDQLRGRR